MEAKARFSKVYHLADEQNWSSIQKLGLLSTVRLIERTGQSQWLSTYRPQNIELAQNIIIRDQRPMPPKLLANCLSQDLTPQDWYLLLNRQVFFWIDLERLYRQQRACTTPQYLMTIDAHALLAEYSSAAFVTPFNTGNARRAAAVRGKNTFVPYEQWLKTGWQSEIIGSQKKPRPQSHKPVELTILDAVPNIFNFVISTQKLA